MKNCMLLLLLFGATPLFAADEVDTRNPFGVPDVPDPRGDDVKEFAARTKLAGDATDANAPQWVRKPTAGKQGSIEGEWSERWNARGHDVWYAGKGPTRIKAVNGRVYMLVDSSNGRFLIELVRDGNRLVGRYQGIDHPHDSGPCVFLIVSDERIDGTWMGVGRWDLRRKIIPAR